MADFKTRDIPQRKGRLLQLDWSERGGSTEVLFWASFARRKNCRARYAYSRRLDSSDSSQALACNSAALVR